MDKSICEKKLGDDDIEVLKIVPSPVSVKNHVRVRCNLGKEHDRYRSTCPCPISHCKSGSLARIFNSYYPDLKKSILSTGKKVNSNPSKVPNWKLHDLNYTQVHFSSKHKSDYNERKRNLKTGLVNNIVINMLTEAIDDDKSNKCNKVCDHLNYHKYIPASWSKIVLDEITKMLKIGNKNIVEKSKMKNRNLKENNKSYSCS